MKSSKQSLKTSTQEECGVWLDTTRLKGKAKQKHLARPVSKLLNPFAGGDGYSLAVALNFTQTKVEMPKTKQSSISAFFTPQTRVLNKKTFSEEPNKDPVRSSASMMTPKPAVSGTKRCREIDLDLYNSEPSVGEDWKIENKPNADRTQDLAASHSPSQNVSCGFEEDHFEEINPPQCKRRFTASPSSPADSQPLPQAWSQDPLFTYSQDSEGEFHITNPKTTTSQDCVDPEPSFLNSLQSEEAFGFHMDVVATTSTQKSFKPVCASQVDDEKENSRFLSFTSPTKSSRVSHTEPLSNHKWTKPKTPSPQKCTPVRLWKKTDRKDHQDSQFKWTKPRNSPRKTTQLPCGVADEDSLAMLFTQDSQGFRVIAHRGLQTRSPLKDHSNISTRMAAASAHKSVVEDEDDEMLFTQDSQGNLVIKH